MHLVPVPARAAVPISTAHGTEQTVRPYTQIGMRATEGQVHTDWAELTFVLLGRAVRAENLGIEKGRKVKMF